ncbi:hypothetical protein [Hydrogenophaga sp. R2]|uniref:hypothetical protein n=1 Tax=Hydrogenophaga sp. R2 TaxID=3132827 RepID=UPI003CF8392F
MNRLDEATLQSLESRIPELAKGAVQQAQARALTRHGKVIEAVNGQLRETTAAGTSRLIGSVPAPTPVSIGLKRVRPAVRSGR